MRGHRLGPHLAVAITGDGEAEAVSRLVATPLVELDERPDLVIRRAEAPEATGVLCMISDTAGSDGERFLVGREPMSRSAAAVDLGVPLELTYAGAAPSESLLVQLLDIAAVRKRLVPLPGAVLSYQGRGIAVLGWPHSGKTAAVLALLGAGAVLVSDERAYAGMEPPRVVGLHTRLELRGHHLAALDRLGTPLPTRRRLRLALGARAGRAASAVAARRTGSRLAGPVARAFDKAAVLNVDANALGPTAAEVGRIDLAFVVVPRRGADTSAERLTPDVARARFAALAQHDLAAARTLALQYRFAFPTRSTDALAQLARAEAEEIARFADDVPFFAVYHASRDPRELLDAIVPLCR